MYKSISIIIPTKNEALYLKNSINSLINSVKKFSKVHKNFDIKIIIVEDGSTDNSYEIISDFEKLNDKIFCIRNEKSLGISKCLNVAINKFPADLIGRFDADDVCKENRFLNQINFLIKNKDIDILGSNARLINENDENIGLSNLPLLHEDIVKKLNTNCPIFHPSVIFKFNVWRNLDGYDNSLNRAQDFDLWRRCRDHGFIFHNLKSFEIDYRLKRHSKTIKGATRNLIAILRLCWKHNDLILFLYAFIDFAKNILIALRLYKPKTFKIKV